MFRRSFLTKCWAADRKRPLRRRSSLYQTDSADISKTPGWHSRGRDCQTRKCQPVIIRPLFLMKSIASFVFDIVIVLFFYNHLGIVALYL